MEIRLINGEDFNMISPLINDWWGGRQMSDMLPRLFFDHFKQTSFIAENNGEIVGFLIGFYSQTFKDEAYIHFIGVHPEHRSLHIGRQLYETFFIEVKNANRSIVKCVTSPVNKASISFHKKMGFNIVEGDKMIDHVSIFTNYDGPKQDRVLFIKNV